MDVSDDDAGLGRLLIQLLRAVTPAVTGSAAVSTPELSVSASEGRALMELLAAHGIAQGELAGLLGLEKSTVSRLAAGLEQKGWIRRGRDAGNQRYVRLYLTPAGSAIAARLLQTWQSRQVRIIASLTDAERAGLAAGLGGLLRGLVAEGLLGGTARSGAAQDDTGGGGAAQDDTARGGAAREGPAREGPAREGARQAGPAQPSLGDVQQAPGEGSCQAK